MRTKGARKYQLNLKGVIVNDLTIKTAIDFCKKAHFGQDRKYTGDPYWNHPHDVYLSVREFTDDIDIHIAALLHDVIEDCGFNRIDITNRFNKRISDIVYELTDKYTNGEYPDLNRKERKFLEAMRLKDISKEAKLIKYFDIMDNSKSIFKFDPKFAKTYLKEKQFIIGYALADLEF